MAIVAEPTRPPITTLQVGLLATGLPMFGFGAIVGVPILAIGGMLLTLVGALLWARGKQHEPPAISDATAQRRRSPVNIPASLAASLGLNVAIALLWWVGSS